MAPKVLIDENLSPTVAHRLTELLYDVTCVRDRGLDGREDWELLEWCIGEGRVICTENRRHFRQQHDRYVAAGWDHFGILTVEEWPTEQFFRALQSFLEATEDIDMMNQFIALEAP